MVSNLRNFLKCGSEDHSGSGAEHKACALRNVKSTTCILYSLFTAYLDSMGVAHAYFGKKTVLYMLLTSGMFAESVLSTAYCLAMYLMVQRSHGKVVPSNESGGKCNTVAYSAASLLPAGILPRRRYERLLDQDTDTDVKVLAV